MCPLTDLAFFGIQAAHLHSDIPLIRSLPTAKGPRCQTPANVAITEAFALSSH